MKKLFYIVTLSLGLFLSSPLFASELIGAGSGGITMYQAENSVAFNLESLDTGQVVANKARPNNDCVIAVRYRQISSEGYEGFNKITVNRYIACDTRNMKKHNVDVPTKIPIAV